MKDKTKTILGTCLIIIGAILLFGGLVYDMVNAYQFKPIQRETNCYDKYNNQILGQICWEETTHSNEGIPFGIIGVCMALSGIFVLTSRSWCI